MELRMLTASFNVSYEWNLSGWWRSPLLLSGSQSTPTTWTQTCHREETNDSHTRLHAAGTPAQCASVRDAHVHPAIPVDVHRIQRNVSVGVALFCTPACSHRHKLSSSQSTSHFFYHTLFFSSHFHSHAAFVLPCSSCCPLPLWFLPCWLFCWRTPAGCHGGDTGGILSV